MKRRIILSIAAVTAVMYAFANPAVTGVTAKQRFPWNGKVDITCMVSGIDGTTNGFEFAVAAVMPDSGVARIVSNFWVVRNGTNSTDRVVCANGNYRLVWDAQADLGTVNYSNMVMRVTLEDVHDKVQLWADGPYWATTNIGAEKPYEYGYYFWWGDIVGYKHENDAWMANDGFSSNFSFDSGNTPTYYKEPSELQREGWITADGVLAPQHDAAQVQWGDRWRMPTDQEIEDLNSKCDWIWTTMSGVNGYVVCGRGNYASASIFLPAAGFGHMTSLLDSGSLGDYWSSVPCSGNNDSGRLFFQFQASSYQSNYHDASSSTRNYGFPVRPVQGGMSLVLAGDSMPFLLDTVTTSTSSAVDSLLVSWDAAWIGGDANATVVISDNGTEVKRTTGTGDFTYTLTGDGRHDLTYTTYIDSVAQDEVYTATVFKVRITGVTAKQRYPWNGKVDITYTVSGDLGACCAPDKMPGQLLLSATNRVAGTNYVADLRCVSGDTGTAEGVHHVVWDLNAQGIGFKSDDVVFTVAYTDKPKPYCVIDLSGGANASSYPVSYLADVPSSGWTDEYKTTKLVLRRIEPGTFMMGGQYQVTLTKPFFCGVFEVTQKQYELVTGGNPSYNKGDKRPVECVSWNTFRGDSSSYNWPSSANVDTSSFVGKLQARTGLNLDLPTEAQWEYACRAGTTSQYNNGGDTEDDLKQLGHYYGNQSDGKGGYSSRHTTVGSYLPNAWGLYDMHGNVLEWCLDWYGNLTSGMTDPSGSSSGASRVKRGGCWGSRAGDCTLSYRDYGDPSSVYDCDGFRLVRTLSNE